MANVGRQEREHGSGYRQVINDAEELACQAPLETRGDSLSGPCFANAICGAKTKFEMITNAVQARRCQRCRLCDPP